MTPSHTVVGHEPSFCLPVTLSTTARRKVLIATGQEPEAVQTFCINKLAEIEDTATRTRVVDLWDKINIKEIDEGEYVELPGGMTHEVRPPTFRNRGYEWLQRSAYDGEWARHLPGTEGESIGANQSFHAEAGRTVTALQLVRLRHGVDPKLEAMIDGAPMVSELESATLTLAEVLTAYDAALELARELVGLIDSGVHDRHSWGVKDFAVSDDAIFIYPSGAEVATLQPVALLKAADPEAFARARQIIAPVSGDVVVATGEAANTICRRWQESNWRDLGDAGKVDQLIKNYLRNAADEIAHQRQARKHAERYEQTRTEWIARHGSQRLRRSAERGYKHDGIYRDERAAVELPGFISAIGRHGKTKELINPSDEALAIERDALARAEALGITGQQVRLVYVETGPDSEWESGEFVQITGYLGRHTLWRSVSGEAGEGFLF